MHFSRSAYEQHHLHSSTRFAIHKINEGTFTAGTFKINFKGTCERYFMVD